MKYYLHNSNSFNDEKITELFMEYGYEGLGLFYTILEKLAYSESPIKTSVLKSQLKVGKKLERIWKFLESLQLISSNNGETFNEKLLKYNESYLIKSEKNKKRVSEFRKKQPIKKNVTHYKYICTPPKVNINNKSKYKFNKRKYKEKPKPIFIIKPKINKENSNLNFDFLENDPTYFDAVKKWVDWLTKEKNKSVNQIQLECIYRDLKLLSKDKIFESNEIVDYSISGGWTSLYSRDKKTKPFEKNKTGCSLDDIRNLQWDDNFDITKIKI